MSICRAYLNTSSIYRISEIQIAILAPRKVSYISESSLRRRSLRACFADKNIPLPVKNALIGKFRAIRRNIQKPVGTPSVSLDGTDTFVKLTLRRSLEG